MPLIKILPDWYLPESQATSESVYMNRRRGSYMQWVENDIAPQVAFEILSPGNTISEMAKKLKFYERHGIEEYYLYDPSRIELTGWQRIGKELEVIDTIDGWVSPRLGIRFDLSGEELELYFSDGKKFTNLKDVSEQLLKEKQRADRLAARLRALGIEDEI
jgi:Uma2 family endonuclease